MTDASGSGAPSNSSGGSSSVNTNQTTTNPDSDGLKPGESVSYDTHRRLLSEKKRAADELRAAQERIAQLDKEAKDRLDAELKAKEDYKTLADNRQKELDAERAARQAMDAQMTDARKLDSFLKTLNADLPQKYWGMINTATIIIDPATKQPDPMSVAEAVKNFRETYPEVIQVKSSTGMSPNAPAGGKGTLTREEWLKLPAAEMAKRMKEVVR